MNGPRIDTGIHRVVVVVTASSSLFCNKTHEESARPSGHANGTPMSHSNADLGLCLPCQLVYSDLQRTMQHIALLAELLVNAGLLGTTTTHITQRSCY